MNTHPSHITINGCRHTVAELLALRTDATHEAWQRANWNFLAEWYDDKSYIEVRTSGSTGVPKLIRLDKDFVAASAQRTLDFFQLRAGDRVLHCLSADYIAGKLMLLRGLIGELDVHLVSPSSSFDFVPQEDYAFAALVVNQMQKLMCFAPNIPVAQILLGGSAIPTALEQRLSGISSRCYSSYAMTETATHIALRKLNHEPSDDYYHCLSGIEVEQLPNQCLQINMPGLSAPLATNDAVELLDAQTFRVLGRTDNCIISGGKKFFPEEIEQRLSLVVEQPFYISSRPHEVLGEELILILEANSDVRLRQEIQEHCARLLHKHAIPRDIVFVDALPRTENGKLLRR
ncbi:MAG: AMP-binding protein [Mangrovibacterium sp.]